MSAASATATLDFSDFYGENCEGGTNAEDKDLWITVWINMEKWANTVDYHEPDIISQARRPETDRYMAINSPHNFIAPRTLIASCNGKSLYNVNLKSRS